MFKKYTLLKVFLRYLFIYYFNNNFAKLHLDYLRYVSECLLLFGCRNDVDGVVVKGLIDNYGVSPRCGISSGLLVYSIISSSIIGVSI